MAASSYYCCKCNNCRGERYVCYSTLRRHSSVYGDCVNSQRDDLSRTPPNTVNISTSGNMDWEESNVYSDCESNSSQQDGYDVCEIDLSDSSISYSDEMEALNSGNDDDNSSCDDGIGDYNDSCDDNDISYEEEVSDSSSDSGSEDDTNRMDDRDNYLYVRWVIFILFRIQHHFNLSNRAFTAILTIFTFVIRHLLHPIRFKLPASLTSAISFLKIKPAPAKKVYVVCPENSCNALYKTDHQPNRCTAVKFSRVCATKLQYERHLSYGKTKTTPLKCFHFIPPSTWLKNLLARKDFLSLIGKCKDTESDVLEDVYQGKLWRKFVQQGFFNDEHNLALMLSVDWFNPYKRSEYKVASITMSVLNLPRTERFKKKWTIIVGIIPGPHEPQRDINTFLKPLMDDLLELWKGLPLIPGKNVRAVLMAVTADLPAVRKITQFLSHKADLGCPRCKIRAEREPGTMGASGRMSYFTRAPVEMRNHHEVILQGREYLNAESKSDAQKIAQKHGVRYSELMRLPYFDMINMVCVDPMHTFLLGMVRKETELNLASLTPTQRTEFIGRVKKVKVPYDIGRLPTNMFSKERLGGATANQWKVYAILYARPCLYKLLSTRAYKSLVLLCQIVSLVSSPIYTNSDVDRLFDLLHQHNAQFCRVYGKWNVSINYHMSLHIPEIIRDFGPPHSFWCFAYERLNGILSGLPKSNRKVEIEVLNKFLHSFSIDSTDLETADDPFLNSPVLKDVIHSHECSETDSIEQSYPHVHWVLSALNAIPENKFLCQQTLDKGDVNNWPLKMMHPSKLDVRVSRDFYDEIHSFFEDLYGSNLHYVRPRISKFGRCLVNGQTFSSNYNSTDRGSIVKAMFVDVANELSPYFGEVQFFFTATAVVDGKSKIHPLSYVKWFKFRSSDVEPLAQLHIVIKNTYYQDHIVSPRRFLSRCTLVSSHPTETTCFVSEFH